MNPVQKTGILALGLLLAVAVIGFLLGPNKASADDGRPAVPVIDIAALPAVEFQPPESRQFWIAAEDFRQQPIQHPLEGGSGRRIVDWRDPAPAEPEVELPVEQGPAPRPAAVPVPATYRVRENDNLAKIAARELGDAGRWKEIARLNGMEDPYLVKIGVLLHLPARDPGPTSSWTADAGSSASGTASAGSAGTGVAADTPPAAPPAAPVTDASPGAGWTSYTVGKNETISEVSATVYGTARLWRVILDANGIDDPRKVRAGQKLRIPPRP